MAGQYDGGPIYKTRYIQADLAPATEVGSQVLKQALYVNNISGKKPFHVRGFDWISQVTPSTPSGLYSGPFRSVWSLQYVNAKDVFPYIGSAFNPTNPTIAQGDMEGHQILAGDNVTAFIAGSVRFDPKLVERPDFGVAFRWRTSSELSNHDVLMLISEVA